MNIDEKDTELKEGQNPDDNSSQEACFVCHRPASKAGKMIHLTDEICICQDCMQKTLDMMNNGNVDYSKMDFSRMPNISMVNLSDLQNIFPGRQKVKKKAPDKEKQPEKVLDIHSIPAPHKIKASLEGADALATGTVVKLSVISEKAENVMTVPVDCVSYSGGQAYVYTYDQAAGAARKVAIEDGLIGSERIQVLSGLDYSDQVITTWTKELYEGAPVQLADGSGTDAETFLDGGESAGAGESPEAGNGEAPMTDAPGEPAADAAAGDAEAPEPAAEETSAEETSANAQ